MRSTLFVFVPVVLAAAALQGCSVTPRDTRAVYEPVTDISSTATPMAQLPPAAGDLVSILQSKVGGVLIQRIVLRGDPETGGENQIVVKVDQTERRSLDVDGPVPKPTESMISGELDENFSAVDMRMSLTWNRNSFGPFGYAIGHAAKGVTCVYAWQYSAGRPPRIVDDPAAVESAKSMPSTPTSVRVRLCRSGLGEKEIVEMLREMVIYPPGSTSPYDDPNYEATGPLGARDALAAAGVAGYFLSPKSTIHDPAARRAHSHPHSHAAHSRHRRVYAARTLAPAPAAGSVVVPLPPGAPTASNAAANPLLAPLQAAAAPRPTAPTEDMPLPTQASNATHAAAANPALAPIPLPN